MFEQSVRRWFWGLDRYSLMTVLCLMMLSIILVASASPAVAERIGVPSFHFLWRHLVFVTVGFGTMVCLTWLPRSWIPALGWFGLGIGLAAVASTSWLAPEIKGARRWLSLGSISVQPSELMKPFFVLSLAWLLTPSLRAQTGLLRTVTLLLIVGTLGLLALQPDIGMVVSYSAVAMVQLFMAGLPWLWLVLAGGCGVAGVVLAYYQFPHVSHRIESFLHPKGSEHYQIQKSLEALQHGGWLGTGPGEGAVKQFLPDSHTDFIFAVLGEEFGVVGGAVIMLLYGGLVLRCLWKGWQTQDPYVIYATTGLMSFVGLQAMINMGVAMHLLPTKGMTLPFISYGGSSMLAESMTLGFVLALTRKRYGVVWNPHRFLS